MEQQYPNSYLKTFTAFALLCNKLDLRVDSIKQLLQPKILQIFLSKIGLEFSDQDSESLQQILDKLTTYNKITLANHNYRQISSEFYKLYAADKFEAAQLLIREILCTALRAQQCTSIIQKILLLEDKQQQTILSIVKNSIQDQYTIQLPSQQYINSQTQLTSDKLAKPSNLSQIKSSIHQQNKNLSHLLNNQENQKKLKKTTYTSKANEDKQNMGLDIIKSQNAYLKSIIKKLFTEAPLQNCSQRFSEPVALAQGKQKFADSMKISMQTSQYQQQECQFQENIYVKDLQTKNNYLQQQLRQQKEKTDFLVRKVKGLRKLIQIKNKQINILKKKENQKTCQQSGDRKDVKKLMKIINSYQQYRGEQNDMITGCLYDLSKEILYRNTQSQFQPRCYTEQ